MNLELMLTQISNITKKKEEILNFTGEKFNIFNLLNLSGYEIYHSKFLAELLNQKGTHGKKNKFLKLFLDCVEIKDFSFDNVITETEKFIGYIPEDYSSGGRIDISLKNDKNEYIFIENKIYADDQPNQLIRYNQFKPDARLLYLTLFGSEPGDSSIGKNSNINYVKISYQRHILKWLELCKIESIDNPVLRETLTQYIVLVKQLTGQERSKEVQKEIMDVIVRDADNVSAAFDISQNFYEVKVQILKDKLFPLMANLGKEFRLDLEISFDKCLEREWGFSFSRPEWKKFRIDFEFESSDLRNLYYGYYGIDLPKNLDEYLRSSPYEKTDTWPFWRYMDHYLNWDKDFFIDLYTNEEKIKDVFRNKIREVSDLVGAGDFEL